ncbi:hypothetical protein V495_07214 [Pseudogymnoascus sp. VKM F-4514 (FW-929)]|nr:hypothetical protein V495_07214 [Pseudogymnoascus sp. VKM F-4514 (FW-929)]KFY56012.1 hypothetical protein V497_06564 [Pseudogymnoascus sp. VKM F-4516 (FW-969)]
MAPFSFLSRFGAHRASDSESDASLPKNTEEASSGPRGVTNKRRLTPKPPPTKADSDKLSEAKPTPATPTILPLVLVLTSPSISALDLGVPLHPAPKPFSLPTVSVAEGVWAEPSARESRMTPSDEDGVEVKMTGLDPEVVGGGEENTRPRDGVVGELMMDAKKAFQSLNPRKVSVSDPEAHRRHHYPCLPKSPKRGDANKSTDLDSFLERLRLGDRDGKEVRSHEGYMALESDNCENEDACHLPPSTTENDPAKNSGQDDYKKALDIEYKKARALLADDRDDEEERATRAFREMYYKKKALTHQQKAGYVGEGGSDDDITFGATNSKKNPLAQQENADVYEDAEDEWKPYVPEKDDDEWEFEYYMSLTPATPWSPLDEY